MLIKGITPDMRIRTVFLGASRTFTARLLPMPGACRLFAFVLLFSLSLVAYGQSGEDTENLVFKAAVYGPGDELFIWWGHAALIVENTRWNFSKVYDWGIFSYPSDNFLLDFIKNQVQYKCTSGVLDIDEYIKEDRDVTVYTLDLDNKAKEAILAYAENKVLPENCYYDYHEFRDNCATGVRDILDLGTGGQFKALYSNTPGRLSLRQHVRRFTCLRPFPDWCFDFLMGRNLDGPISAWEEMFLPVEIGRNITDFRYIDNSGEERSLVRSAQIIHSSKNRDPILNRPLTVWPIHLALGLILAFVFLLIKKLRGKFPAAGQIAAGAGQGLLGLFLGAAGSVLFFGLFILPHDYIRQNINFLFINPLLFLAAPLGIITAAGRKRRLESEKHLRLLWAYVFIAGFITILAGLIPAFHQQNQSAQALILPAALVLAEPERFSGTKKALAFLRKALKMPM